MSDTISNNRALPVMEVSQIPTSPDEFKPSPLSALQALRKLADRSEAEALRALEESEARGDLLAKDLGNDVPTTAAIAELRIRKEKLIASKARLRFLVQYFEELDDITNHDIVEMLDVIESEYEHNAKKKPQIRENYPALQKYGKLHSDAVREGIARAKQQKKEEP